SRMNFDLWKENIASAARIQMGERRPWLGPIRLMAEFQLPAPGSVPKYKRGWLPHIKRPDIDKLTRVLLGPLKGIVWGDDSQVCYLTVNKVYAWDKQPGAVVIADFLTDEWCESYGTLHTSIINAIDSL